MDMFGSVGLPRALAYVVARAKVLGRTGLLVPCFTRLVAGLAIVMVDVVVINAIKIPGGLVGGIPDTVLLMVLIVLRRLGPTQQVIACK